MVRLQRTDECGEHSLGILRITFVKIKYTEKVSDCNTVI